MSYSYEQLKALIQRKRAEFERFDALPVKEQRRLTEQGLNPHEPYKVRKAKQKIVREEIQREFRRMPIEARKQLLNLGIYDGDCEVGIAKSLEQRIVTR